MSYEKAYKFEDKSIFKFDQQFADYLEPFSKFLDEHDEAGAEFQFPEKDPALACILSRAEYPVKHFMIYDIFQAKLLRKVEKQDYNLQLNSMSFDSENKPSSEMIENAKFSSDAFDIDQKGEVLIYAYGKTLKF